MLSDDARPEPLSRTELHLREESLPQSPEAAFETLMARSRPKGLNQRTSGSCYVRDDEFSHAIEHAGSHRALPDAFVHVKKFANRHVRDSDGSADKDIGVHQYNDNSEEDAIMSDAMDHLLEETPANLYNQHHQMQAPAEPMLP